MRALRFLFWLSVASLPSAAWAEESSEPVAGADPHAAAHQQGGIGHQLTVYRTEGAVEVLGRDLVQIWGDKQVWDCKSGTMAAELRCEPCELPRDGWADQAPGQWMAQFSWPSGDENAERSQRTLARHYAQTFDMYPAGGQQRGEGEIELWSFRGPRNGGQKVARIVCTSKWQTGPAAALLPPGEQELEIRAEPLSAAGAPVDAPIQFTSGCAELTPAGPRAVRARLRPGAERCEVAAASPRGPGIRAGLVLSRAVKVDILYDRQPADTLELPAGVTSVTLTAQVAVSTTDAAARYEPDLQWRVEGGAGELKVVTKDRARFTLAPGMEQGEVVLQDARSGAEDRVVFTRGR